MRTMEQLILERFELFASRRVNRFLLQEAKVRERVEEIVAAHMYYEISGWLYGEHKTKTVHYPADWLEAIKERFAPAWLRARWPVRYTSVTLDAWRLFPEATLQVPALGPSRIIVPVWSGDAAAVDVAPSKFW